MISIVIASPGTQAKTAPSVRRITFPVALSKPPQPLFISPLDFLLLVALFCCRFYKPFLHLMFYVQVDLSLVEQLEIAIGVLY